MKVSEYDESQIKLATLYSYYINASTYTIFSAFVFAVDVKRVFGEHICDYAVGLCRGDLDYLVRMPMPLLIYMVSFMDLHTVARLSQTSKLMYDVSAMSSNMTDDTEFEQGSYYVIAV